MTQTPIDPSDTHRESVRYALVVGVIAGATIGVVILLAEILLLSFLDVFLIDVLGAYRPFPTICWWIAGVPGGLAAAVTAINVWRNLPESAVEPEAQNAPRDRGSV